MDTPLSTKPSGGLARKLTSSSNSSSELIVICRPPSPLPLSTELRLVNWATLSTSPELITTFRPAGTLARRISTVPDFTSRLLKPLMTLPSASTTVSSASAKSNTSRSPPALRAVVTSLRVRCSPGTVSAMSATFNTRRSLPSPRSPCRVSTVTVGALSVKVSAAAVPLNTTVNGVLASLAITLLARSLTVVVAVVPLRLKLALPSAPTVIVIAPRASPLKLITPSLSLSSKLSALGSKLSARLALPSLPAVSLSVADTVTVSLPLNFPSSAV